MILSMGMIQYGIIHRTNPVRRDGMRNTPFFVALLFAGRKGKEEKSWSYLSGRR